MLDTVIFLHIPRTAGTTLHNIIERHYPSEVVYSFGSDAHASARELESMPLAQRSKIRMLKGHLPYGVHDLLSGPSTYFTLLRDPVERAISLYYYVKRVSQHPLHEHLVYCGNMKNFFESGRIRMSDNGQTRLVSGVWDDVPFGEMGEEFLKQAKKNLEVSFSLVGLTCHFDETLLLLRHIFGWQDLLYKRKNVTRGRPCKNDLCAETLSLLYDLNELDLRLYEYGRKLFWAQVRCQDLLFKLKVWLFKFLNWRYNNWHT
jgi:hypothetical protein